MQNPAARPRLLRRLALVGIAAALAAGAVQRLTAAEVPNTINGARLTLTATEFSYLPGWGDDDVASALPAFLKSCARFARQPVSAPIDPDATGADFGTVGDWRGLCRQAAALPAGNEPLARRFFEANFVPELAANRHDSQGLFTGYYQPDFIGSLHRGGEFQTPVYRTPPDLVRGKPYLPRGAIDDGALKGRGLALIYLANPDDLYVLQTQGSGRIHLTDGTTVGLVYDANNGRPPVNIEKLLFDSGVIPAAQFSQQAVRGWMRSHPAAAEALRRRNPEYVFFREHKGDGPIGAQGAVLTPERSLAVDHRFVPLGMPLWLAAQDKYRPVSVRRLVVAQDIGDGITGPVRGDFFWGNGPEASRRGADFYATGQYYLLLPRAVAVRQVAER